MTNISGVIKSLWANVTQAQKKGVAPSVSSTTGVGIKPIKWESTPVSVANGQSACAATMAKQELKEIKRGQKLEVGDKKYYVISANPTRVLSDTKKVIEYSIEKTELHELYYQTDKSTAYKAFVIEEGKDPILKLDKSRSAVGAEQILGTEIVPGSVIEIEGKQYAVHSVKEGAEQPGVILKKEKEGEVNTHQLQVRDWQHNAKTYNLVLIE